IVKQGDDELPGLTDTVHPKRLGPKRATKIRKFFGLTKEDDVRKFVIRREVQPKTEGKKPYTKAPRIQRLVTPQRLQHKRHRMALKRRKAESSKDAANEYAQILAKRVGEVKAQKSEARSKFILRTSTPLRSLMAYRAKSFFDAQIEVGISRRKRELCLKA
ncbi:MAG: hypothetical protein Q9184_002955, partial [Pyrenodesmia sp. 2 TL-2023]